MKVVILAPIDNSPYALAVSELARREPGVEVSGIVVRRIVNVQRLRGELRRDGVRLVRKVWRKLVVGAAGTGPGERSFHDVVRELGLADARLARLARRHDIPYCRVPDHNDPASIAFVRRLAPDVVAFTGGGLVRRPLLEVAGQGIFNAHMGLLPRYRGMDVVEWPLLEGRGDQLGVTLHFMDPGVDTGPLVASRRVEILPGDSMERLRTRYEPVMVELMLEGLRQVREGRLVPTSQEKSAGRQYFVLHPRLYAEARRALARRAGPSDPG